MRRPRRPILACASLLFAALALQQALAGCGGTTTCDPGACTTGTGGTGGGAACKLDPPGNTFTFHLHNAGATMYLVTYACGGNLPIQLDTPAGKLGIGPGPADYCEVKCDSVYAGQPNNGCSDCGPGYDDALDPGKTVDIKWDRRVYQTFMADPKCSGSPSGNNCALGLAVAPLGAQKGTLTLCTDLQAGGYCSSDKVVPVSFTIDTTKDEGTIEVQ